MIRLSATLSGHEEAKNALSNMTKQLGNARQGLAGAVKNVAKIWQANFKGEGSGWKHWDELADRTVDTRIRRGYSGEHPILHQSGSLQTVAIDLFADLSDNPRSQTRTKTPPYSDNQVSGTLTLTGSYAKLEAHGYPVVNQWGNPERNLPARPFWFVNAEVEAAARQGLEDWVKDKVA